MGTGRLYHGSAAWFNRRVPEPLEVCPFVVALQVRQEGEGGAALINPGTSLLMTPTLPRSMSFIAAFSLVLTGREAGRHRIRVEVTAPGGGMAGENEDDYQVPAEWKAASERARLVTIPVRVELAEYGTYLFRLLLDGTPVGPPWPLWVRGTKEAQPP
jgi:hypothetical protein